MGRIAFVVVLCLSSGAAAQDDSTIYRYKNARGRTVYANGLDRVPTQFRETAETMIAGDSAEPARIYSYVTPSGRTAYVHGLAAVPVQHRDQSEAVDLSHVSLNEEIAEGIEDAVEAQYDSLIDSDFCATRRAEASMGYARVLWQEHGYIVVACGFVLLLIVATPWMLRRVEARAWVRFVSLAIPVLAVLTGLTHGAVSTARSVASMTKDGELCTSTEPAPGTGTLQRVLERTQRVQILQQRLQEAYVTKQRSLQSSSQR